MLAAQTVIALRNAGLYQDQRVRMEELRRTQQSLVQSAKLAAIGELAASVAHEINNPLTVILGNSQLLLYQLAPDSAEHRKAVSIETEANRARSSATCSTSPVAASPRGRRWHCTRFWSGRST